MENSIKNLLLVYRDNLPQEYLDFGLYSGKCADILTCFIISSFTGDTQFSEIGYQFLDEIAESLDKVTSLDFDKGLAGIGWMIEWLAQNRFIECNTDEVLDDIDTLLYKTILYSNTPNISLATGLTGLCAYFLIRLKSENSETSTLKNLYQAESLKMLLADLHKYISEIVIDNIFENLDELPTLLKNLSDSLTMVVELMLINLNFKIAEEIFYRILNIIDQTFENATNYHYVTQPLLKTLNYMAHTLHYNSVRIGFKYWQVKSNNYLNFLNSKINLDANFNTCEVSPADLNLEFLTHQECRMVVLNALASSNPAFTIDWNELLRFDLNQYLNWRISLS